MLIPHQLLFFLEVLNYLCQTFLQNLDFALQNFNLFLLQSPPLIVLVISFQIQHDIPLEDLILVNDLLLFSFVVVQGIPLGQSFLCQFLIFIVDVPLNFLDVYKPY